MDRITSSSISSSTPSPSTNTDPSRSTSCTSTTSTSTQSERGREPEVALHLWNLAQYESNLPGLLEESHSIYLGAEEIFRRKSGELVGVLGNAGCRSTTSIVLKRYLEFCEHHHIPKFPISGAFVPLFLKFIYPVQRSVAVHALNEIRFYTSGLFIRPTDLEVAGWSSQQKTFYDAIVSTAKLDLFYWTAVVESLPTSDPQMTSDDLQTQLTIDSFLPSTSLPAQQLPPRPSVVYHPPQIPTTVIPPTGLAFPSSKPSQSLLFPCNSDKLARTLPPTLDNVIISQQARNAKNGFVKKKIAGRNVAGSIEVRPADPNAIWPPAQSSTIDYIPTKQLDTSSSSAISLPAPPGSITDSSQKEKWAETRWKRLRLTLRAKPPRMSEEEVGADESQPVASAQAVAKTLSKEDACFDAVSSAVPGISTALPSSRPPVRGSSARATASPSTRPTSPDLPLPVTQLDSATHHRLSQAYSLTTIQREADKLTTELVPSTAPIPLPTPLEPPKPNSRIRARRPQPRILQPLPEQLTCVQQSGSDQTVPTPSISSTLALACSDSTAPDPTHQLASARDGPPSNPTLAAPSPATMTMSSAVVASPAPLPLVQPEVIVSLLDQIAVEDSTLPLPMLSVGSTGAPDVSEERQKMQSDDKPHGTAILLEEQVIPVALIEQLHVRSAQDEIAVEGEPVKKRRFDPEKRKWRTVMEPLEEGEVIEPITRKRLKAQIARTLNQKKRKTRLAEEARMVREEEWMAEEEEERLAALMMDSTVVVVLVQPIPSQSVISRLSPIPSSAPALSLPTPEFQPPASVASASSAPLVATLLRQSLLSHFPPRSIQPKPYKPFGSRLPLVPIAGRLKI